MELSEKKCETATSPLTLQQISNLLPQINGWELEEDKIYRFFNFEDFKQAVDFINRVADISEQENHYPEVQINHNTVKLALSTNEVNGLSEKDFILAEKINQV